MLTIEIIEIVDNKNVVIEKLKGEDFKEIWRPHINETIVIDKGQYLVHGVAHMWDKMVIKVFVKLLFKHK